MKHVRGLFTLHVHVYLDEWQTLNEIQDTMYFEFYCASISVMNLFTVKHFLFVRTLFWFRSGVLDSAQVSTVKMLKYKRPCSKFGLL